MTKQDFADQFDYEALSIATRVRVHPTNGEIYEASVMGYWPGPNDTTVDIMQLAIPPEYPTITIPSPEITSIDILKSNDEADWGTHAEVGLYWAPIDEVYAKHRS